MNRSGLSTLNRSQENKTPLNIGEFVGILAIFISLFLFLAVITPARSEDPAATKKLFDSKCAQCHGKDAKGVPKMAKVVKVDPALLDLTRADAAKETDESLTKTIAAGKKKMPKFKGKLTDSQTADVLKYIRSLQSPGK